MTTQTAFTLFFFNFELWIDFNIGSLAIEIKSVNPHLFTILDRVVGMRLPTRQIVHNKIIMKWAAYDDGYNIIHQVG